MQNSLKNRPIVKFGIILTLAAIILAGGYIAGNWYLSRRPTYIQMNTGTDGRPVNNITVSAMGKVSVTPDIVTFYTSYNTKKNTIKEVQEDLNRNNNSIIRALKEKGIQEKDIQTIDFNIQPTYRWESNTNRRLEDGHTGKSTIYVKVRDTAKAGEIIDSSVTAGANEVTNITFTIDNNEKPKSEARKKAAEAAKKKADELASGSGVGLGGLIAISETTYDYSPITYRSNYNYADASFKTASQEMPAIAAGSLEVTVNVSATYGIAN